MNVRETSTISNRKAWIAFVASLSCLLVYVLACVLSPPAWSPDSSKIAILVTPPGDEPDKYAIFTYDIATGERVLLDEVKANGSLSTPAWSPNGEWVAYYRVDPTNPVEIPRVDSNSAPAVTPQTLSKTKEIAGQVSSQETGERLSEEDKVLPSILFELVEDFAQEEEETDLVDMKLMLVRPDGSQKKTLHTVKLESDNSGENNSVAFLRPVWAKDCQRIFYVRGFGDIYYVESLDISTGKTCLHLLTSALDIAVSPDGKWIASFTDDNGTLVTGRVDGSMCKYFKLDMEFDDEYLILFGGLFWSPDSRTVFIVGKESSVYAVDITTGQTDLYTDPDANETGYYAMSAEGDKLYYLASSEANVEGLPKGTASLRYTNLSDRCTGTVFTLPQSPEVGGEQGMGVFSISPNGKVVVLRSTIKDDIDVERSVLVFLGFDGKTQKIVKTDRWLFKPLYSESDLTFEEKLIGKWNMEDGQMVITKGSQPRTYRLTWPAEDKEYHAAASLVQLKGMTLLGIFGDESLLENKDAYGSHLLPDIYMRIVQTEPKLLMQVIEYDELSEILEGADEFIRSEDIGTEDIVEFERIE